MSLSFLAQQYAPALIEVCAVVTVLVIAAIPFLKED